MKEIALLGATASGKSALAIEVAKEVGANILSLDSLAIYHDTDIVSAKPTLEEQEGIKHFGLDILTIDAYFSASTFFELYKEAKAVSQKEGKHLIIVGGTSFYLKSMIGGLSSKLTPSEDTRKQVDEVLKNLEKSYQFIQKQDPHYAQKISHHDSYRIGKWYEIYFESGLDASTYFQENQKEPVLKGLPIYDIMIDRTLLRERISKRSSIMIEAGVIDEVFNLEKKYTRLPTPMKAIGIVESLAYLDGKIDKKELHYRISTHTAQLAKRQETFNKAQFSHVIKAPHKELRHKTTQYLLGY
jgi:tRNA dimethylallyltransferase